MNTDMSRVKPEENATTSHQQKNSRVSSLFMSFHSALKY